MLLPRSHAWTRPQKWLIVGAAVLALAAVGGLVYYYERYHRGPTESVFFGTWQDTLPAMDSTTYFQFDPDHSLVCFGESMGEMDYLRTGQMVCGRRVCLPETR